MAASAVLAFQNDEELSEFVQENSNSITETLAVFGERMGSMPLYLGGGGYILGVVFKDGRIKKASAMIVKAGLVTGLITRALKMGFSRARPSADEGAYSFYGPDLSNNNVSFPSGHTTTAFSFATVIAETFKDESKLIPILAYGAAAIGGWSRVHDNAHWVSDVLIGALIGHLTTKKMMENEDDRSNHRFLMDLFPVFGADYVGVHLVFRPRRDHEEVDENYLFGP